MNLKKLVVRWSLLLTVALAPPLLAQPTAFTYQGQLELAGAPANGQFDLRFALYDAASGGAPQGNALTNTATAVRHGLFTVTLDFGAEVFPGAGRWLEIGVATNGGAFTTLSPRQAITSAPSAVRAAFAQAATSAASAQSLAASNLAGTLTLDRLPAGVLTNGSRGVSLTGTFTGNGTGITNVAVRNLRADVETIVGWGTNTYGELSFPRIGDGIADLAAGYAHVLALKRDGTIVAWGDNSRGQTNVPAGLSNVVAIAAGGLHSLALKRDGTVVGWGDNRSDQILVPAGLREVVAIAAGFAHSLALKRDGRVVAWGDNFSNQASPPTGLSNVAAIGCGDNHSLAIRSNGTVVAWGLNDFGQTDVPSGLSNVVAGVGSRFQSLALRANGTVVSWGIRPPGVSDVPEGLSDVVAIAARFSMSVALRRDGTVVEWGENPGGAWSAPTDLTNAVAIAVGYYFDLALRVTPAPAQFPALDESQTFTGTTVFTGTFLGSPPYLHFTEEQPKGTAAGGNVAGVNVRRFSRTVEDSHALGELLFDGIRLPAGTYHCRISAPAYRVDEHQIRLATDAGEPLLEGTSEYSDDALNPGVQSRSLIDGPFTLATTTVLKVEHYMRLVKPGNGLGLPAHAGWTGGGPAEVYAVAEFWKIK